MAYFDQPYKYNFNLPTDQPATTQPKPAVNVPYFTLPPMSSGGQPTRIAAAPLSAPAVPTTQAREQSAATTAAFRPADVPNRVPITTPQDMDRMRANAPSEVPQQPVPAVRPATRAINFPERTAQFDTAAPQPQQQQAVPDPRTQQLIADYNRSKVDNARTDNRNAYFSALDQYTPSSGDTWFDFIQKGFGRRALTQAYRDDLERQRLDNQFALQDQRGAIDRGMQEERLASESALQKERLGAASTEAEKAYNREAPNKEATRRYMGSLAGQAEGQTKLTDLQVKQQQNISDAYDTYTAAVGAGDTATASKALNNLRALTGVKGNDAPFNINEAVEKWSLLPEGPQKDLFWNNIVGPHLKRGYATGGAVGYGQIPQPDDLAPVLDMYRKYVTTTQALGATPIGVDQFVDLMHGARDHITAPLSQDPTAMGMPGYATGGAVGYGQRLDGTEKGRGWLGEIRMPDGQGVMTEMSVGAPGTNETYRPSIVPGTHPADINYLRETGTVPQDMISTSQHFADKRIGAGQSPFYATGGAVDVSGQQVMGPGTGTSDSIPAVVDGNKPAALSTGEFVFTNAATDAAGANALKAVMSGLERGDPKVVSGVLALAAKAVSNEHRGK